MIRVVIVCDGCNASIAAGPTLGMARRYGRRQYRRIRGRDLCRECCRNEGYTPPGERKRKEPTP